MTESRSEPSKAILLIAACFFVSGFAALLYETVWLRQFAILLGTSEQALAIVLASYMGGLALGSWLSSLVIDRVRRPFLTYGVLECGIALSALLVPVGLTLARIAQRTWLGGQPEPPPAGTLSQTLFNIGVASGLIIVPTTLMGATLPLLARHVVRRDQELGPRIGLLYAINTAGAVLGTMTAAFFLMPAIGMGPTTWVGASANFIVFVLVVILVRGRRDSLSLEHGIPNSHDSALETSATTSAVSKPTSKAAKSQAGISKDQAAKPYYRGVLWLIAGAGGVSFCYEILFTRMLSHQLGGSVFAFATMLSGFLAGLALGGAACSRLATTRSRAAIGFVYAQLASALGILLAFYLVNESAAWRWQSLGGGTTTPVQVLSSILILLPTAIAVGSAFPFAIRVYARDASDAAPASAKVYAMSTIGGIIGSLITGAMLMPWLAYHGATMVAVLGNIAIALVAIGFFRLPLHHAAGVAVALIIFALSIPSQPDNVTRVSSLNSALTPGRLAFHEVGRSATVSVFYQTGDLRFQTNGLPEAGARALGSSQNYASSGNWLSALPVAVRPNIESMMIVGLGGGVAAASVPPSVTQIDVVELSEAVVRANESVAAYRNVDPLQDPRVRLIINDARNALALTEKRYDSIVSQPSHPWTAGSSHLYTVEFARTIREHLNPGGIFLQWISAEFIDEQLLGNMAATILDVFPHGRMYQPQEGLFLFVASDQPIQPESDRSWELAAEDRPLMLRMGIENRTHLLAHLALDEIGMRSLAQEAAVIRDEQNLLAMRAPFLLTRSNNDAVLDHVRRHHPATRGADALRELCPDLDWLTLAKRLLTIDMATLMTDQVLPIVDDPSTKDLIEGINQQRTGGIEAWKSFLMDRLDTKDPRIAYYILHTKTIGKLKGISDADTARLTKTLTPKHQRLMPIMTKVFQNQVEQVREHDEFLDTFNVDDVAFETIIRMRIPWRLEAPEAERIKRNQEAIQLYDQYEAFSNAPEISFFRFLAAIKAEQSFTALTTACETAKAIEAIQLRREKPVAQSTFNNFIRIARLVVRPDLFANASRGRYQEVLKQVQQTGVILEDARRRAGMQIVYPD
ncbi:MAG: fused MFS/spermidine synthase [Planctomycetota bacterium]